MYVESTLCTSLRAYSIQSFWLTALTMLTTLLEAIATCRAYNKSQCGLNYILKCSTRGHLNLQSIQFEWFKLLILHVQVPNILGMQQKSQHVMCIVVQTELLWLVSSGLDLNANQSIHAEFLEAPCNFLLWKTVHFFALPCWTNQHVLYCAQYVTVV